MRKLRVDTGDTFSLYVAAAKASAERGARRNLHRNATRERTRCFGSLFWQAVHRYAGGAARRVGAAARLRE